MKRLFILVDDDPEDAELFAEALATLGNPVDFAHISSGEKLFAYLNSAGSFPDLVFLDINMPGISGWKCLELIKSQDVLKDLAIVMYSTSSVDRDKWRAIHAGASGFLTKPESFSELVSDLRVISESQPQELNQVLRKLSRI